MQKIINNIISVSGGKDSTATILLAMAMETENLSYVFADTGHEHPTTYDYLDYLENKLGITIKKIRADFTMQIERKRQKLIDGNLPGWSDVNTDKALEVLNPIWIPFLDLCLWKVRFPYPLYLQGMKRVGCMPCVNCGKMEMRAIAERFPAEVDRVREWERQVSHASRRGSTTFFCSTDDPMVIKTDDINYKTHGIDRRASWAKTLRGGRKYDLFAGTEDITQCSSSYGLCE